MGIGRYIKKSLRAIVKWSIEDTAEPYQTDSPIKYSVTSVGSLKSPSVSVPGRSLSDNSYGMNFTVYGATGGKIIEIRVYDARTDRYNTNLYVITDKEELGEELAQIITKESLCR